MVNIKRETEKKDTKKTKSKEKIFFFFVFGHSFNSDLTNIKKGKEDVTPLEKENILSLDCENFVFR